MHKNTHEAKRLRMVKVNRYTPGKEKSKEKQYPNLVWQKQFKQNIRGDKEERFETLRCHNEYIKVY